MPVLPILRNSSLRLLFAAILALAPGCNKKVGFKRLSGDEVVFGGLKSVKILGPDMIELSWLSPATVTTSYKYELYLQAVDSEQPSNMVALDVQDERQLGTVVVDPGLGLLPPGELVAEIESGKNTFVLEKALDPEKSHLLQLKVVLEDGQTDANQVGYWIGKDQLLTAKSSGCGAAKPAVGDDGLVAGIEVKADLAKGYDRLVLSRDGVEVKSTASTGAFAFLDEQVEEGKVYTYRCARERRGRVVADAAGIQASVPNAAPEPGQAGLITVAGAGASDVSLSWIQAVDNFTASQDLEYAVYRSDKTMATLADALAHGVIAREFAKGPTTAQVSGLEGDTTYQFAVLVRDRAGNQGFYPSVTASTSGDTEAPVAGSAGALQLVAKTDSTVALSWTAASDDLTPAHLLSYDTYKATSSVSTLAEIQAAGQKFGNTELGSTDVTVTGLLASTTYHFNVVVKDLSGHETAYAGLSVTTLPDATPPVPGDDGALSTSAITEQGFLLNWAKGSDAVTAKSALQYRVYYSTNAAHVATAAGLSSATASGGWTADLNNKILSGLSPQTAYHVTVAVKDASGNVALYAAETVTTSAPPGPTVSFALATSTESEAVGTASVALGLNLPSATPVQVSYAVSGTASAGDHGVTAGTVTFGAGEVSKTISVPVTNDALDELAETIVLTLNTPVGLAIGTPGAHTLTINDDDALPDVIFGAATSSVAEGAGSASVQVNLTAASGQPVTVAYRVNGGTALGSGVDYTLADGTLTFAPGETAKSIAVVLTGDTLDETNETIDLVLENPGNANLGGINSHTLTVNDDDGVPSVAFAQAGSSKSEAGGAHAVAVVLSAASAFPVTVNFSVTAVTATLTDDYTVLTGGSTLTFAPGETSKNLDLNVVSDSLSEANETVQLALSAPANASLGGILTHTLTITDDDGVPGVSFTLGASTKAETGGSHAVEVRLSAASSQTITVDFSVTPGTAANPADYSVSTGGTTLTFPPGVTTRNVDLLVADDAVDEADETLTVAIANPTNATLGTPASHTVTILDNEGPPTVAFALATSSKGESGGTHQIQVTLSSAASQPVTVDFAVSGGSATEGGGSDFTVTTTPLTLTFSPGDTAKTIDLALVSDALDEPNETVVLAVTNPANATLGGQTSHTLTITDDDGAPDVAFAASSSSKSENLGTHQIVVSLSAASAQAVTVNFAVTGGNATDLTDFSIGTSSPLTFSPGETSKSINVTPVNDALDEVNETATLTLSSPSNANLGAQSAHVFTITDDDTPPTVAFAQATSSRSEGGTSTTLQVNLSAASAQAVTVDFAVSGGTAVDGTDFNIPTSSPMTFAAGETSKTITVTITQDAVNEGNETVVVELSNPSASATLGAIVSHTLTIVDDEGPPTVAFALATSSRSPESGTHQVQVTLSGPASQTVSVDFSVSGGTATSGTDFSVSTTPATLTFAAGETAKMIDLAVASDTLDEPNETVVLALSNPVNTSVGATGTHTFTINDDDGAPSVYFTLGSSNKNENLTSHTIQVELSAASGQAVTVDFAVTSGSATDLTDFSIGTSSPITFAAGETTKNVVVTLLDDTTDEINETVVLGLSSPSGATLGGQATHTFTINDDDGAPTLGFQVTTSNRSEGGTSHTIQVTMASASAQTVTVDFAVQGASTAIEGTDFSIPTASPLSFAPGQTSKNVTVTLVSDSDDENDETVVLALSNPANATLNANSTHTFTINDDDGAPSVAFASGASSKNENAGAHTIDVNLSAASVNTVTVTFAVANVTTVAGDYTVGTAGSTLTFSPGQTTKSVVITPNDDATDEANETLTVTLSSPSNATLGGTATHTMTIVDDDSAPTVAFAVATSSRSEAGATHTVTVNLSSASAQTITAEFNVTAGNAVDPDDYDVTNATTTLTFNPGQTSKTIDLTVAQDSNFEGNETVEFTLLNPVNTTLGATQVHTFTITDDDVAPVVEFALTASSVLESEGTKTVTVNLTPASASTVTVTYAVAGGGTATTPADFSLVGSTLSFSPGQTTKTFTVTVASDGRDENAETAVFSLSSPSGANLGTNTVHTLTINDSDAVPTVQFAQATTPNIAESAGSATIQVSLSAASDLTVGVSFTVTGTATKPTATYDDHQLGNGSVSFAPGETTKDITLPVDEDSLDEDDETVILTLVSPSNATLGAQGTHTATIVDNDAMPVVQFASSGDSKAESFGATAVTVTLSTASGRSVNVPFTLSGSASSADHTLVAGTLVIPAHTASAPIDLNLVDDLDIEASETLVLTIGSPTNATLGAPSVFTLTITDNDTTPLRFYDVADLDGDGTLNGSDTSTFGQNTTGGINISTIFTPGTVVLDDISNSQDGTLVNFDNNAASDFFGTGTVADPYLVQFDGSNDYVSTGTYTAKSYIVWFKADTVHTGVVFSKYAGGGTQTGVELYYSGQMCLSYYGMQNCSLTLGYVPNTWYNVAITWDGATTRFYVNGVQVGTYATTSNDLVQSLTLGRTPAGSNPFDGSIAQFRAYSRDLTPTEVRTLYETTRSRYLPDPGVQISRVTPAVLSTTGGTAMALYGWNLNGTSVVTLGGTAATSVGVTSDAQISAVSPARPAGFATVAVTATDGSWSGPRQAYYTATATDSMPLFLSPANVDALGTAGNGATTQNWVSLVGTRTASLMNFGFIAGSGWRGTTVDSTDPFRLELDGVNDYVNVGSTSYRTYSLWFKADTVHTGCPLGRYAGSGQQTQICVQNYGAMYMGYQSNTSVVYAGYSPGTWHHGVMSNDGVTTKFYLDGQEIGSRSGAQENLSTLFLGSNPSGSNYFDGAIANFRAYTRSLSVAEVLAIFEEERDALIPDPGVRISRVVPALSPLAGGGSATIFGSGFAGTTSVTVGGQAASFSGVSDSSITVTLPPGSLGFADVVVTAAGGSDTAADAVRYTNTAVDNLLVLLDAQDIDGAGEAGDGSSLGRWSSLNNAGTSSLFGFGSLPTSGWGGIAGDVNNPYRLQFDGSNDEISLGEISAKTYAVWFKADTKHSGVVIGKYYGGGTQTTLSVTNYGQISMNYSTSSTYITSGYSPGVWYHAAMTNDGATSKFYLDGRLIGTVASGTEATGPISLGDNVGGSTSNFDGAIGEFRAYGRDLTEAELRSIYEEGIPRFYADPGVPRIDRVTESVGPTTSPGPVVLRGWNFTGVSDPSDVTFGGVNAASYTVDSAHQITATPPNGAAGYADVSVSATGGTSTVTAGYRYTSSASDSLIVYLDASNIDGKNGHGTAQTATAWNSLGGPVAAGLQNFDFNSASGWKGDGTGGDPYRLLFDGSNDYISTPSASAKTYAVWFKLDTLPGGAAYVFSNGTSYISISSTGAITCRYGASSLLTSAAGQIAANTWYHIAMTADGTNVRCHRNGAAAFGTTAYASYESAAAGVFGSNNGSSSFMDGSIGQIRVYSRALTPAEVTTLYSADSARFP